jgi:hypothetical protein
MSSDEETSFRVSVMSFAEAMMVGELEGKATVGDVLYKYISRAGAVTQ